MDLQNDKALMQNLKDSGCSENFIKEFVILKKQGNNNRLIQVLYKHKAKLLANLHDFQKKIDCLDYLIFQINQFSTQK